MKSLFKIRVMKISDHKEAVKLWKKTEGMGYSVSDSKENVNKYLKRNRGLSFVALNNNEELIGTILSGHDGKRAFIYHLAVDKKYRGKGIGKELVKECIKKLRSEGIPKCMLAVFNNNTKGKRFWQSIGWFLRKDLTMMQFLIDGK